MSMAGIFSAGIFNVWPYTEFLLPITCPQNPSAAGLEHVLRKFAKYNSPKWTGLNFVFSHYNFVLIPLVQFIPNF